MRYQRYVIFALIAGAILTGVDVQAATVSGFAQFGVADTRMLDLLNLSTINALGASVVTMAVFLRHPKVIPFTDEVVSELAKVTWPTKDETVKASTTVVFTALFTAALLGLYDLLWKNLADLFLFTEG